MGIEPLMIKSRRSETSVNSRVDHMRLITKNVDDLGVDHVGVDQVGCYLLKVEFYNNILQKNWVH